MEYRLNKIDPEIRQVINDATKDGKVHGNKGMTKIDKDGKDGNKEQNQQEFKNKLEKQRKKKLLVDAVKENTLQVDAFKEEEIKDLSQGRFLDTTR